MFMLLRMLLALDLGAVGCEQFAPSARMVLPLGGSHLAQLALILISVVVIDEARTYIRHLRAGQRRRRRRLPRRPRDAGRLDKV